MFWYKITDGTLDPYNSPMKKSFSAMEESGYTLYTGNVKKELATLNAENEIIERVIPPVPKVYSSFLLMEKLESVGLWARVKYLMQQNKKYEKFIIADNLKEDNKDFQDMLASIQQLPETSGMDVEAFLEDCRIE